MALEKLGHLTVADKFTTSGLFLTFPYRRARLLVEWHGLIAPRGDRQQDFSGLLLVGLWQFSHLLDGFFQQLAHKNYYTTLIRYRPSRAYVRDIVFEFSKHSHVVRTSPLDRIMIDHNVCFGKPCMKGTRICSLILDFLASGETADWKRINSRQTIFALPLRMAPRLHASASSP